MHWCRERGRKREKKREEKGKKKSEKKRERGKKRKRKNERKKKREKGRKGERECVCLVGVRVDVRGDLRVKVEGLCKIEVGRILRRRMSESAVDMIG